MKEKVVIYSLISIITILIGGIIVFDNYIKDISEESIIIKSEIKKLKKDNAEKINKLNTLKEKNNNEEKNINNMSDYIKSLDNRISEYEN